MENINILEILYMVVIAGAVLVIYRQAVSMIVISILILTVLLYAIRRINRSTKSVNNKTVLITCCDTGVGKNLARYLGDQGFKVYAGVRSLNSGGALALQQSKQPNITVIEVDTSCDDSCRRSFKEVQSKVEDTGLYGVINCINNTIHRDIELTSMADYQQMINSNLLGVIRITKTFLPLIRSSKGCVVNVSSMSGLVGLPLKSTATVTQFAIEGFTESLRLEMRRFEVRVSLIQPSVASIIEKCEDEQTTVELTGEIMDTYGQEYIHKSFNTETTPKQDGASLTHVHEAVLNSLLNEHYIYRYTPTPKLFDSNKILVTMRPYLPLAWLDIVIHWLHGIQQDTRHELKVLGLLPEQLNPELIIDKHQRDPKQNTAVKKDS